MEQARNNEKVKSQTLGQEPPRAGSRLGQTGLAQAAIVDIIGTPPLPTAHLRSCERASWTGQGHVRLCDTPFLPWACGSVVLFMKGVVFKGASPARTKGAVDLFPSLLSSSWRLALPLR